MPMKPDRKPKTVTILAREPKPFSFFISTTAFHVSHTINTIISIDIPPKR